MLDPGKIIRLLAMEPHPEGGYFAETYRHVPAGGGRGNATAIYYLLCAGEVSHWHRIDATEIWHWYAGAPLVLKLSADGRGVVTHRMGPDLQARERPQVVVPAGSWQSAESLGAWSLVGCTVSPAFDFEGFELAPPGWYPKPASGESE